MEKLVNCNGWLTQFVCSSETPEPAEAKLTPVIRSLFLSFGSRYGGTNSFKPKYDAENIQHLKQKTSNNNIYKPLVCSIQSIHRNMIKEKTSLIKKHNYPESMEMWVCVCVYVLYKYQ